MDERKLTLAAVGHLAGVSKSVVADWLKGTTPADLVAVKRLADALGVSMAYLTTGERDKATDSEPRLEDVLREGDLVEGIFKVSFQRLIPKKQGGDKL